MKILDLPEQILSGLSVVLTLAASMVLTYIADAEGDLHIDKELALKFGGGVVSLVVGSLVYALTSKQKYGKAVRVSSARKDGLPICGCSESGEIMITKEQQRECRLVVCERCENVRTDFSQPFDHRIDFGIEKKAYQNDQ